MPRINSFHLQRKLLFSSHLYTSAVSVLRSPAFKQQPMSLAQALKKGKAFLSPRGSSESVNQIGDKFRTAPEGKLFPQVEPAVAGEDCDHACAACETHLPKTIKIDEKRELYGHVKEWATHMLVATGKSDWLKEVTNEKDSVMEAMKDCNVEPSNGVWEDHCSNIRVHVVLKSFAETHALSI